MRLQNDATTVCTKKGGVMIKRSEELMSRIIEFAEDYYLQNNASPPVRAIAGEFNINASTAYRYLVEMNERGLITYDGRNIGTEKINKMQSGAGAIKVPLVGRIACGTPNLAEENIEEYISFPKSMFGEGKHFILRANGNSMIDIGIASGDLVVIKQATCAENGQVVAALVDNEATLKRYYKENGHIRLHPENSSMEDIIVDDCTIQGIAVKVFKDVI